MNACLSIEMQIPGTHARTLAALYGNISAGRISLMVLSKDVMCFKAKDPLSEYLAVLQAFSTSEQDLV